MAYKSERNGTLALQIYSDAEKSYNIIFGV
jgi:hypothetical protein